MITAPRWRRLHSVSAPVLRGGMSHPNLVRRNRFGSDIAAGRSMAPTRRCSLRSVHTAVSSMTPTWPRWSRSIPPASGPTSTPLARAPPTAQWAPSFYTNLADEPAHHALGRSRGRWTTKIHALIHAHCAPLLVTRPPAKPATTPSCRRCYAPHRRRRPPLSAAGHKAYSHHSTRAYLRDAESRTPFPSAQTRSHAAKPKGHKADAHPDLIRALSPPQRHRTRLQPPQTLARIATRYDKYALTFLGGEVTNLAAAITHHRVPINRHARPLAHQLYSAFASDRLVRIADFEVHLLRSRCRV